MAYIYKITNKINGKIYIGKTEQNIEERFKQHLRDARQKTKEIRPLYRAINKYGSDNFIIEVIEETLVPEEREIYWINQLNAYRNGYNATLGGDGKRLLDYDKVIETYLEIKDQKATAEQLGICHQSVKKILTNNNIPIFKSTINCKIVKQFDLKGNYIAEFYSCGEAARWLIKNNYSAAKHSTVVNKITDCCNNRRQTAYGFMWSFK